MERAIVKSMDFTKYGGGFACRAAMTRNKMRAAKSIPATMRLGTETRNRLSHDDTDVLPRTLPTDRPEIAWKCEVSQKMIEAFANKRENPYF